MAFFWEACCSVCRPAPASSIASAPQSAIVSSGEAPAPEALARPSPALGPPAAPGESPDEHAASGSGTSLLRPGAVLAGLAWRTRRGSASRRPGRPSSQQGSGSGDRPGFDDGGTGGPASSSGGRRASVEAMRAATVSVGLPAPIQSKMPPKRFNSQIMFNLASQTVIVFDWDDTLFPTSWTQDELCIFWDEPVRSQCPQALMGLDPEEVEAKLKACEMRAAEVLEKASELAHVAIVTLASKGWVDMSCKYMYPDVGKKLNDMDIPIIYAQDRSSTNQVQYNKQEFQSNEELERFYGTLKGQAISEEVEKFYSQYEGQSWKNVLSIGDSSFERYGLLAATSAYMQGQQGDLMGAEVWGPTDGHWQKVHQDGSVKKLRAKCCKLVDSPDCDELTIELEMVARWLEDMVNLDAGFDMDLEGLANESQVAVIEAVLKGKRPVGDLATLANDSAGAAARAA